MPAINSFHLNDFWASHKSAGHAFGLVDTIQVMPCGLLMRVEQNWKERPSNCVRRILCTEDYFDRNIVCSFDSNSAVAAVAM